jgi:hypothetical protein
MTIVQQLLRSSLTACIVLAFFGCNNNGQATASDAAKSDTLKADTAKVDSPKPAAVAAPAMALPFDVAEVNETLKDFASWKPIYDSTEPVRKNAGLDKIVLSQVIDKPNMVQAVYKITDVKKVTDFFAKPDVKALIAKAGVIGKPDVSVFHVIRFNPDSKEKQWVEVTHKVKNFDAWLKVYDGEGKDKRLGEGMVDVAMARGIPDSNLVHLVFDIKDMAKAKAAIASDDKKKIMMSAGVVGAPKIVFYKEVD